MSDNAFDEYAREVKLTVSQGHTVGALPGSKFYIVEVGFKEGKSNNWQRQRMLYFSNEENARKYVLKEIYLTLCHTLVRESLIETKLDDSLRLSDPARFDALSNPIMNSVIEDFRLRGGSELRNRFLYEFFDETMDWLQFTELDGSYTLGSWLFRIQSRYVEKEIPHFPFSNRTLNSTYRVTEGINGIIEDKINRDRSVGVQLTSRDALLVAQALGCELESAPLSSIFEVRRELYPMPVVDKPSHAQGMEGAYFSTRIEADSRAILDSIERLIVNEGDTPWGMKFPSTDEEGQSEETSYLKSQRQIWADAMKEWVKSHSYSQLKPFIVETPRMSEKLYTLRSIVEHKVLEDVVLSEESLKEVERIAFSEVSSGEFWLDEDSLLKAYTFIAILATN